MKNITVVIVTFRTPEKIILDCLKSISKDIKVLIIENSEKFFMKEKVLSTFNNVEICCSGKNLGYGAGNNFGLKKVKTDYALILNPDTVCDENFFSNLPEIINQTKDFSIIGCQYLDDEIFMPAGFFEDKKNKEFIKKFRENNINEISKVDWVTGQSMIINLKKFENNKIFDEKFFLYLEEIDLCKSLIIRNENIFSSKKLKVKHLGSKGSIGNSYNEKRNANNLKNWHYMWSSFYFYKKNYNYFFALKKMFGKFFRALIKTIFFSLTFQKNKKDKYLYRFLGVLNSILGKPSSFRGDNK